MTDIEYHELQQGLVVVYQPFEVINEIYDWLAEHEMHFRFLNTSTTDGKQWSSWYIPDETNRMMFILRWSK
jgi:protein-tyrosine phosphatase